MLSTFRECAIIYVVNQSTVYRKNGKYVLGHSLDINTSLKLKYPGYRKAANMFFTTTVKRPASMILQISEVYNTTVQRCIVITTATFILLFNGLIFELFNISEEPQFGIISSWFMVL